MGVSIQAGLLMFFGCSFLPCLGLHCSLFILLTLTQWIFFLRCVSSCLRPFTLNILLLYHHHIDIYQSLYASSKLPTSLHSCLSRLLLSLFCIPCCTLWCRWFAVSCHRAGAREKSAAGADPGPGGALSGSGGSPAATGSH